MITDKQVELLEDMGIQVKAFDGGIRQLGNIAKSLAKKWTELDYDEKNILQKEFLGKELTSRQEYTIFLLKNSIKLSEELIKAMKFNAEIGQDITMLNAPDVLYDTIDMAIDENMYIDISCTKDIEKYTMMIKYSKDHNLGLVVLEDSEAKRLAKKFEYEHIYSLDNVENAVDKGLEGVIVDITVPYANFADIPLDVKTGLVNALKGI